MTDDETYQAAVETFQREPEALTMDQIKALTTVDKQLGDRALHKRAEAQQKAAEARHRASMGEPPLQTKAFDVDAMVDQVLDVVTLALAKPRSRIAELEQKNQALEARVLELEAQKVISHVEH